MSDKRFIFTGARAELKINDKIVGYATNCSGGESLDLMPITVLNNVQVVEFVPVGYTVTFTASKVRLINVDSSSAGSKSLSDSYKFDNLFPKTDANPAVHLDNMLRVGGGNSGFTVTIMDSISGKLFMRLENAQMQSRDFSFGPRDVVMSDVSFVGTRMFDQADG